MQNLPRLFDGLTDAETEFALTFFDLLEVDIGTPIMAEGDEDTSLVCVVEGHLEIKTGKTRLGAAKAGDLLGEMALFGSGIRTASVDTLTPVVLLLLERDKYVALRDKGHPIARAIEWNALDHLIGRLRETSHKIGQMAQGITNKEALKPTTGFFNSIAGLFGQGGELAAGKVDKVAALAKSPLFQGAPKAALTELAGYFGAEAWRPGTFICRQGRLEDHMYLVVSGEVDVLVAAGDDRVEYLAVLEAGEAFGMGSLVQEGVPRMASCVAKTNCTVLTLAREPWNHLIADYQPAASALRTAMIKALTDQLAYANGNLALLDIKRQKAKEKEMSQGTSFKRLARATAGMEAHGQYMEQELEDDDD